MSVIYSNNIVLPKNDDGVNEVEILFDVKYKITMTLKKISAHEGRRITIDDDKTVDGKSMGFIINYSDSDNTFGVVEKPLLVFTRTTNLGEDEVKEKVYINFVLETLFNRGVVLRVVILSQVIK
jgi:hypothetical protein